MIVLYLKCNYLIILIDISDKIIVPEHRSTKHDLYVFME